eukprot:jgi/Chrzof1/12454/Cz06g34360.t1
MQAQQLLQQQYPGMEVVGSTYPVPALKQTLAQLISGLQMALLGLIFFGPKIFETLGYPEPPALYNRVAQNKFGAAMMVWLLGGMLYNQLMSTGAFEIFYNGKLIFSKLAQDRLPRGDELFAAMDAAVADQYAAVVSPAASPAAAFQ